MGILIIQHLIYLLTNGMYNLLFIPSIDIIFTTHTSDSTAINKFVRKKILIKVCCEKTKKLSAMNFHSVSEVELEES